MYLFCSLHYKFTENFMVTFELEIGQQLDLICQKLILNYKLLPIFRLESKVEKGNTMPCFHCILAFCITRAFGNLAAFIHFCRWRH